MFFNYFIIWFIEFKQYNPIAKVNECIFEKR